jgi:hypothetical protein
MNNRPPAPTAKAVSELRLPVTLEVQTFSSQADSEAVPSHSLAGWQLASHGHGELQVQVASASELEIQAQRHRDSDGNSVKFQVTE